MTDPLPTMMLTLLQYADDSPSPHPEEPMPMPQSPIHDAIQKQLADVAKLSPALLRGSVVELDTITYRDGSTIMRSNVVGGDGPDLVGIDRHGNYVEMDVAELAKRGGPAWQPFGTRGKRLLGVIPVAAPEGIDPGDRPLHPPVLQVYSTDEGGDYRVIVEATVGDQRMRFEEGKEPVVVPMAEGVLVSEMRATPGATYTQEPPSKPVVHIDLAELHAKMLASATATPRVLDSWPLEPLPESPMVLGQHGVKVWWKADPEGAAERDERPERPLVEGVDYRVIRKPDGTEEWEPMDRNAWTWEDYRFETAPMRWEPTSTTPPPGMGPDLASHAQNMERLQDLTPNDQRALGLAHSEPGQAVHGDVVRFVDGQLLAVEAVAKDSTPARRTCLSCGRLQNEDGTLDCGH